MPILPYTTDGGLVGARAECDTCHQDVDVSDLDGAEHGGLPPGWISATTAHRITATLCSWQCVAALADARADDQERQLRRVFGLN